MEATGNCYEANASYLISQSRIDRNCKFILVHGMVTGQGKIAGMRTGHCWLESGDYIYDYSNGRKLVLQKLVYYAIGEIDESKCKKYTPRQVKELIVKFGHWGPWETISSEEE